MAIPYTEAIAELEAAIVELQRIGKLCAVVFEGCAAEIEAGGFAVRQAIMHLDNRVRTLKAQEVA